MSQSKGKGAQRAVQVVKAAVHIGIGAAVGGPPGAAAAAVKELAPKLIKLALYLIAAVLLIIILIFFCLPCILFGYPSSDSADIQTMTQQANSLDAQYKGVGDITQEEIQEAVTRLSAGYDDVQTDSDLSNSNLYWFIAITSVYYNQDLNSIGDAQIREMVQRQLTYDTSTGTYTEGEGDDAVEKTSIQITARDLDPEALMDSLGFTDEQKNWARLLYSTMTDDQTIREGDPFDSAGQNYGAITFTDGATEVVYYNQGDSRWGGLPYGKTGTIKSSGCGPTSLAMCVASLTGNMVTPADVAKWAFENGFYCEGIGSYHSLIPNGGRHYGLTVEGIGLDGQKAADALASGKLIIAIMSKGRFTSGGHYIVLRGVTSDGKVLVADPGSVTRSQQEWDLRLILNEARHDADAGGPLWVLSAEA